MKNIRKLTALIALLLPSTTLAAVGGQSGSSGGTGFEGITQAISNLLSGSAGKAILSVLLLIGVAGIIFPSLRRFIFIAIIFAGVAGSFGSIITWLTNLFGSK